MNRSEELRLIEAAVEAGRVRQLAPGSADRLLAMWVEDRANRKAAGIKQYWRTAKRAKRVRAK